MKYPGYDYAFEIGQHVIINWPGDPDHGVEATVNNYGYYPDGILYELDIPDGYSGRWLWKQPKFRHRGMLKQFLSALHKKIDCMTEPYSRKGREFRP